MLSATSRRWLFEPQVCYDPATLAIISTVATVAGTGVAAAGTLSAGQHAQAAAEYEAQQQEVAAQEAQAAASRDRDQLRRRKELALSALTARAAASGFSATDPTALNLAEDIAEYGTYQEQLAMYGGTSRRAGLEAQAAASRASGRAARIGSRYKAAATILGGVSTIADRYNPLRSTPAAPSTGLYYGSGGSRHGTSYG